MAPHSFAFVKTIGFTGRERADSTWVIFLGKARAASEARARGGGIAGEGGW